MSVETQERKLELIQWLSLLDDESVLDRVSAIRDAATGDWWDEISDAERSSIRQGIADADAGRVTPHSKVRELYKDAV